jgi:hypothetical protein
VEGSVSSGTEISAGFEGAVAVGAGAAQLARKPVSKTNIKNFPDAFIFVLLLIVETTGNGSLAFHYVSVLPPSAALHPASVVSREFKQLLNAGKLIYAFALQRIAFSSRRRTSCWK